jgi:murein L,D-transpeptidase YafK
MYIGFLGLLLVELLTLGACAPASTADTQNPEARADRVIVHKSRREMILDSRDEVLETYRISLGANPEGHKRRRGDERTPEGVYVIDHRNPHSAFHLSLHISYPNEEDRMRARDSGVDPGGDVFIHGMPNGFRWLGPVHLLRDWTDGCIAVTSGEIEEIWRAVPDGTPIEILP